MGRAQAGTAGAARAQPGPRMLLTRRSTTAVRIGSVTVGGGPTIVVQSMASTDTADVAATTRQVLELGQAGSERVA